MGVTPAARQGEELRNADMKEQDVWKVGYGTGKVWKGRVGKGVEEEGVVTCSLVSVRRPPPPLCGRGLLGPAARPATWCLALEGH